MPGSPSTMHPLSSVEPTLLRFMASRQSLLPGPGSCHLEGTHLTLFQKGLEARDLQMLGTIAQVCRNLHTINISTAGNSGDFGPSSLPANLPDSLASLRGLSELQLTMGRSGDGGVWSGMASDCLVEALAACTTSRSLILSETRSDSECDSKSKWMPKLVWSLPNLEHLALGKRDCGCQVDTLHPADISQWWPGANVGQFLVSQASLQSLCIAEIGVHELAGFMSSNFFDRFPVLRSLEIKVLHDNDCEDPFEELAESLEEVGFRHGRAGNLNVSVSDQLHVCKFWLLFFLEQGFECNAVHNLLLQISISRLVGDEDYTLFQGIDTKFFEERARLVAEELPHLQGLTLIHFDASDVQAFLAGCMAFTQELQGLKRLELQLACYSQEEFMLIGQMVGALCTSAASVERAHVLDVQLEISSTSTFTPSQIAKLALEHGVNACVGAYMQSFQTASRVHFSISVEDTRV
ncbi:hypothetical protein DUNSADRAFT_18477 [Dunaliella salina]|uniref:Uncharacterized protein n=1 Tax=Dunaliella salina TaxID=3046 RepID=A0ABQ7G011_DUNSA|nr:hypothetical protein DUNSADRAFT_18477 [Dunaliella salina]|eukprot:KAF5827944.1 hypothetical protein DUNSADRAFT_18477 [Dunaliella salina]